MMMIMRRNIYMVSQVFLSKQAVGGLPPQYAHCLSSGCGRQSASWLRLQSANRNVAVGSHGQYVPRSPLQLPDALTPWWVKRPGYLDLWSFDLESGVRVTCDVSYLCANWRAPWKNRVSSTTIKLRKSLVKPVTRKNISSCLVLSPEIVMHDAFNVILWTSADICVVMHDDLG